MHWKEMVHGENRSFASSILVLILVLSGIIVPVERGHPQCVELGDQSGPDWASGYWGRPGEPPVVVAFPAQS